MLWRAATNAPLGKAYDEDGKVVEYPLGKNGQVSPLVDEASEVAARHHVLKTNLIANGYLDFTPIEGLTFRNLRILVKCLACRLEIFRRQFAYRPVRPAW